MSGRSELLLGPAGATYLGRGFFGTPRLCRDGETIARLELAGDDEDAARVRELLVRLDEAQRALQDDEVCVFLLGYEASVALDPLSVRKPRDPTLGPDAWLRIYRRVEPAEADANDSDDDDDATGSSGESREAHEALALTTTEDAASSHRDAVARCREELFAGTLYQANIAHRLRVASRSRLQGARLFVERTRKDEPTFTAWADDEEWGTLVSLSPEAFLRFDLTAETAVAYPIKGTRPRGATPDEDARLLRELRTSTKDAAEHEMIVDLLRNDLGRVALPGQVTVTELMRVVTVPNVFHLESEVVARLQPGTTLGGLLAATAPGGSITGAPKSAAVDVIAALEHGPRGPYTGTLGAIDARGRGAASLLIRTWLRPDRGEGALHVGGGIVVDSDPGEEWQETLDKAAAFGPVTVAERH